MVIELLVMEQANMSVAKNTSVKKPPVVAKPKSRTAVPAKGKVSARKPAEPGTKKRVVMVPGEPATIKTLVPGTPEAKKAGTNTMIQGVQSPYGYTQLSKTLTIEPGFTTGMNTSRRENFTDKALNTSGLYRVGNTNRYRP